MRSRVSTGALASVLGFAILLSCDSPSGPGRSGDGLLDINVVSEGFVRSQDTARYTIPGLTLGEVLTVHLQALSGSVTLEVHDSSGGVWASITAQAQNSTPLGYLGTRQFLITSTPLFVRLTGSGQFRVRAYQPVAEPESRPAEFALGDTVSGEWIDVLSDVDVFTFQGQAGNEIIAFLRGWRETGQPTLTLRIEGHGLQAGVHTTPFPDDTTELERHPNARFVLPASGEYTVRATGMEEFGHGFVGEYQFLLLMIDRLPERAQPTAPVADTVAERLDHVGDIDEFVVTGSPGSEFIALFRAAPERAAELMTLSIDTGQAQSPGDPPTLISGDPSAPLAERTSGRFALPATGQAKVRIQALDYGLARGRYELAVLPIDRAVEAASPTIALGDSVLQESIDHPGDIDEYALAVPDDRTANLLFFMDSTGAWAAEGRHALTVQVLPGSPGAAALPPLSSGYGRFVLPAGNYTVRVEGSAPKLRSYHGPYSLHLHEIRLEPESASAVLAVGDTISDALDPPGDVDSYTFDGQKGDHIDIQVQGTGTPGPGSFVLLVRRPTAPPFGSDLIAVAYTPRSGSSLNEHRTDRLLLPETGTYSIVVQPNGNGGDPGERGPYRLAIVPIDPSPEHHGGTLQAGDTVLSEALDVPSDVDEFTLVGSPGQELTIFLTVTDGTRGLDLEIVEPSTRDVIDSVTSYIATEVTSRFTLPPSGVLIVRVHESRPHAWTYGMTGPYRIDVVAVNRAPESVVGTVGVADTIAGELIDPRGDIDEYALASSGAAAIVVDFQTPSGAFGAPGLTLEVVEQATGTVIGSATTMNPTATLEEVGTGPVVLSASSTYLIRVRGASDRQSYGLYRFAVRAHVP